MDNNLTEYEGNMQKLVSVLQTIVESDEYVIIQEKYGDNNSLEYGMYGHLMTPISFSDLHGQTIGEFLYQGIYTVAPDALVTVMHVNAFGDVRDDVVIDLNDKVHAVLLNQNHKYDAFVANLLEMMAAEDADGMDKSDNPAILSKKIKPLGSPSK